MFSFHIQNSLTHYTWWWYHVYCTAPESSLFTRAQPLLVWLTMHVRDEHFCDTASGFYQFIFHYAQISISVVASGIPSNTN